MGSIRIKRIYEEAEPADGYRVLVDRLWPRGIKKEDAHIDLWLKDVGPSDGLRKEFGHDPEKFDDFAQAYRKELRQSDAVQVLIDAAGKHDRMTLLFGAKDKEHNQAAVLNEYLIAKLRS
ncbi:DUF488 domain-containing protein [Arthrobacter crystallopoietes]|jgi:uncharacterized protein YeaO (DUF488 family)|uniref:Uncharacterized conserved protein YeaO, DUF488 family n=1 Tax=Crystallibacter crystallopoietes TaxID=37928 RepID=A0A1H1GB84_9MICC|nr:DUF488 domain-containing protein [Arthrobacter crystallopoietes]SDR10168.1 Uncharacterized conserved protein YeaO, DUF488 family [Arthrobacter crystallopoietes]